MTGDEAPGRALSTRRLDRQDQISRYVLEHGSATVDQLSTELGVSRMTILRDLDELDQQGVLRKVRGGATATRSSIFESRVTFRSRLHQPEKDALCREALSLIEPGQSILMDESTTLMPLARQLPTITPLTVVTNYLELMQHLAGRRGIHLIGLGGDYVPHYAAFHGQLCLNAVAGLRVDTLFMSAAAAHGRTLFGPDERILATKRAFMKSAQTRVLLLDTSKFGQTALHVLADMSEFDHVIVNDDCPEDVRREIQELGVTLTVAPVESATGLTDDDSFDPTGEQETPVVATTDTTRRRRRA